MVLLNRFDSDITTLTIDLYKDAKIPPGNYHVKDLWHQEALELVVNTKHAATNFTISNIEAHGVVALRFDRK